MHINKGADHRSRLFTAVLSMLVMTLTASGPALAASAAEIDRKVAETLKRLYEERPGAKTLADEAKGILVFPETVKLGFLVGGQFGYGALSMNGKTTGYYRIVAASFGLQAGLQAYATVLMFMDDASLNYFDRSGGWEIGTGPSVVVLDKGQAGAVTSTTLHKGVFAFVFNQQGAMAAFGLEGTKITSITPDP